MSPGYIAALVLAGLTVAGMFVGFFVLLVVGAIEGTGESDKYGRVALPGQGTVELPAGEASVFYEERVKLSDGEELRTPRGLEYSVRPTTGGAPLAEGGEGFFDEEISVGGTTRTSYGEIEVPAAGAYVVEGRFTGPAGPMPALTFGEPLTAAVFDKVKYVLWGLVGFPLAALIALATFARNRLVHEDERVTMPPEGGA